MNVVQREKKMGTYLLSTMRYGQQLNHMKIKSNIKSPIHAGRLLSSYRVKVGVGLILLNNIYHKLDNQSLRRARSINRQIYRLLKDALSRHYYVIDSKVKLPYLQFSDIIHKRKRIPINVKVINPHSSHSSKYILKKAINRVKNDIRSSGLADNYLSSMQGAIFMMIIGLVVLLILLFICLLFMLF